MRFRGSRWLLTLPVVLASGCQDSEAPTAAPTAPEQISGSISGGAEKTQYVIVISIDGLRPDAITNLGSSQLPNFYRLRREGAFTDNARTDYDYTITLPSHITLLTGRPVGGSKGHGWTANTSPAPGETLHSNKGSYVASVFDVVHDNGLRTAVYASKSRFELLDRSYDATNGAPDRVGTDNGRDKIDVYAYDSRTSTLVSRFISDMRANPAHFSFVHLRDTDSNGHNYGWDIQPGSSYAGTIKEMDQLLGQIFDLVENTTALNGRTAILVISDHGGSGFDHFDSDNRRHYTIPFYTWGPTVKAGSDLYALNSDTRQDPSTGRPTYDVSLQPIRNGDVANLALSLLNLGAVPGSTINAMAKLRVNGSDNRPAVPLVSRWSGKCMDVSGRSSANGAAVQQWDCHSGSNQQWTLPPAGTAGEVRVYGTMCLDAAGGWGNNGDAIIIWSCHGGANQQWTLTAAGELKGLNGKCVDVAGWRGENGTRLQLWSCHGGSNQAWSPGR